MKRYVGGFCALLAGCLMASVVSAASIQEIMAVPFDPRQDDFGAMGYGTSAYLLTWNGAMNGNLFLNGQPSNTFYYEKAGGNPAWLKFENQGNGGGGGGGGGGGNVPLQSTFNLGNKNGGAWSMDFSVLLFDPDFTGTSVKVELLGSAQGSDYATKTVDTADVVAGLMVTWHIDAEAGEEVIVRVTADGDETYAAGFFMQSALAAAIPEPATMALLALGLGGLIWKRRR